LCAVPQNYAVFPSGRWEDGKPWVSDIPLYVVVHLKKPMKMGKDWELATGN